MGEISQQSIVLGMFLLFYFCLPLAIFYFHYHKQDQQYRDLKTRLQGQTAVKDNRSQHDNYIDKFSIVNYNSSLDEVKI